ncbi:MULTISPECIES: DUF4190 domain-containing protein [Bacillaceae]|uniref:DUF4190 domain-containing protein n=1 Tax=Evansella alkalicola TaxID=745819 RepID=A0ABS6JWK8_9BACI|nr:MULTISPECIES: DUF4190 domain-containing protein [Bacillaceae]MBU9722461.1 DUF4190 domain-containing protein [Bacillus alkalicola]
MSHYDNNEHPRDFHVVKDERSNDVKYDPEHYKESEYREETAAEYAPNPGLLGGREEVEITSDRTREMEREDDTVTDEGKGMGTLAVALSIVSLFFLPIIFAGAGLILGFMTVNRGHKGLGYTAVVISAFTIIMAVFFAPFVT